MGGVGPGPACAPWGSMRGPGPALRVPPSHPGECLGGGVRVYLWRTPPAWGSGLGSAYARTLGNKPENVPGAELLRHHIHFECSRPFSLLVLARVGRALHPAGNRPGTARGCRGRVFALGGPIGSAKWSLGGHMGKSNGITFFQQQRG